jgi:hypothetical protein
MDPRMEWTLADMPTWEPKKAPKVDRALLDKLVALYAKAKKLTRLADDKAAFPDEAALASQRAEEFRLKIRALLPLLGVTEAQLEELARARAA